MSVTEKELVDKLISMGYSEEVATKIAKSRKTFKSNLAKDNIDTSSIEDQQDLASMHNESIVTKINKLIKGDS